MHSASAPLRQTDIRVRFRCDECDVAWTDIVWTDTAESSCWVCDINGSTTPNTEALREGSHFELDFH